MSTPQDHAEDYKRFGVNFQVLVADSCFSPLFTRDCLPARILSPEARVHARPVHRHHFPVREDEAPLAKAQPGSHLAPKATILPIPSTSTPGKMLLAFSPSLALTFLISKMVLRSTGW